MVITYSTRAFAALRDMNLIEPGAERLVPKHIEKKIKSARDGSARFTVKVVIDNTTFTVTFHASKQGREATITAMGFKV
ncbi:hypothetical protein ACIQVO_35950 [Streptomyces sp. NPDC101062]|uniref:hypothetical protein n=1 Tax=unclassified Streptomyces TaxID=2593676 RepID=UPI0037F526E8